MAPTVKKQGNMMVAIDDSGLLSDDGESVDLSELSRLEKEQTGEMVMDILATRHCF